MYSVGTLLHSSNDSQTISSPKSSVRKSKCFPCEGKPHAPRNCTLWNQTSDSVEVSCVAGFDGGLPQHFLLEVYSGDDNKPRYGLFTKQVHYHI